MFVPVVDLDNNPLMPTSPARARRWVASGKATPFWKQGIWCVRLNREPSARNIQYIVVGVDPGSKREGFTVKSELHTYLNIQAHAVDWVKKSVETRRILRRSRRNRNTPCRQPRWSNRHKGKKRLSPSTRARWQWKLRVLNWLAKIFPIHCIVVEDINAKTRKGKNSKWNKSFSPLEVGKKWFYQEIESRWRLETRTGYKTKELRDIHGLKKCQEKLALRFDSHCVDSWVLANDIVGGHLKPDNKKLVEIRPLRFHRRQLHVQQSTVGGIRKPYGTTRSQDLKRGSIVIHSKCGESIVGGESKGRISLHDRKTGKRLCQNAKREDIRFRTFNSFTLQVYQEADNSSPV